MLRFGILVIQAEKLQVHRPKVSGKLGLSEEQKNPVGQDYRQKGYGSMNRIPFIPIKGDFKAFDFEQLAQLPF